MTKKKETIRGFSITKRELTEEEATRPMTYQRIKEFHHKAGEDLLDQVGMVHAKVWLGFLMAKEPTIAEELINCFNNTMADEVLEMMEVFEEKPHLGYEAYYKYFAEYLNLTKASLKRYNQVVIQVCEHYKN